MAVRGIWQKPDDRIWFKLMHFWAWCEATCYISCYPIDCTWMFCFTDFGIAFYAHARSMCPGNFWETNCSWLSESTRTRWTTTSGLCAVQTPFHSKAGTATGNAPRAQCLYLHSNIRLHNSAASFLHSSGVHCKFQWVVLDSDRFLLLYRPRYSRQGIRKPFRPKTLLTVVCKIENLFPEWSDTVQKYYLVNSCGNLWALLLMNFV